MEKILTIIILVISIITFLLNIRNAIVDKRSAEELLEDEEDIIHSVKFMNIFKGDVVGVLFSIITIIMCSYYLIFGKEEQLFWFIN